MKVYEAWCYAFLTITITASCAQADSHHHKYELRPAEKRTKGPLAKRDAFIIMDHFPVQNWAKHHPKFIYSRISKHRYRSPRPRYGVTRTRYSVKPSRKIMRRYRNSVNTKYGEPSHYKRPPKFRYAHQKAPSHKAKFAVSKRSPYNTHEPSGFGEPPIDLLGYNFVKTAYGKPSVYPGQTDSKDSLKRTSKESIKPHDLSDLSDPIDVDPVDYDERIQKEWHQPPDAGESDSKFAPSYIQPAYSKPKPAYESHYQPDFQRGSLFNFFNYDQQVNERSKKNKKSSKAKAVTPQPTVLTEPTESQIVVGGKYAEPPARYFSQYDRKIDDGDFAPIDEAMDPDIASSATSSPYVNYKHSNVAFSPQNLNDAFSIVQ